ncbi:MULTISPECIES: hypothetical protein [unclassified Myroides]|uniref:hypothetical protein n=1 Tax=unclassified Myroides TaxID=2642485 RepID=UPI003D2F588C
MSIQQEEVMAPVVEAPQEDDSPQTLFGAVEQEATASPAVAPTETETEAVFTAKTVSASESEKATTPPVERKVSALSLSSIRARKEMESSLEKKVINPDDLPKDPFTAEQFMDEWTKYADKLARSGFMLMASLMGMVPPVIKGTTVSLEMPNEGSKLSFDENKFDLVNYLRKKLSNYDLEIEIIVNEEVKIQKRVLDKEDKLVRFIELNPAMQYMKEIFDLEFKY